MNTNYLTTISPSFFITERHVQTLWAEKKLSFGMTTAQGESIEVISPGIWNFKAGPDFLQTHIRIGKMEYRGDVEIHLDDQGWYQHGHHTDSRYNQVILHLSLSSNSNVASIRKENGHEACRVYIDSQPALDLDALFASIHIDFGSTKQFESKGMCSQGLFQKLSDEKIKELLRSAAYWRMERKLQFLKSNASSDLSLAFASGIAMALGYRHNAQAFFELFHFLFAYRDIPRETLLAIALGCCGFLEEGRKASWESSYYYQDLRKLWWEIKNEMTHQATLRLDNIRPLHHPIRRLAYLTHLLQDRRLEQLWPLHQGLWQQFVSSQINHRQLENDFLEAIPLYNDPYWDFHFTFESHSHDSLLPCLGKDVKMHILLNVTLPLLYSQIKEKQDSYELSKLDDFYGSLEVADTSKSDYLQRRFFDSATNKKFLKNAQVVQGAYQIHHDFCMHYESSCDGCPFVARYYHSELFK
jgi:hypothetical protein